MEFMKLSHLLITKNPIPPKHLHHHHYPRKYPLNNPFPTPTQPLIPAINRVFSTTL